MSHLGRPKGKIEPEASLRPVADRLAELLPCRCGSPPTPSAPTRRRRPASLKPGEVLLLENVRFNAGETKNDPAFAKAWRPSATLRERRLRLGPPGARLDRGHRALLQPRVCRAADEAELEHLGGLLRDPPRPFVAILGGAKVDGKVDVIRNLLARSTPCCWAAA